MGKVNWRCLVSVMTEDQSLGREVTYGNFPEIVVKEIDAYEATIVCVVPYSYCWND